MMDWHYPQGLPVVACRDEILSALRAHDVIVVVSETGSGKTTQLPKMVAEALRELYADRMRLIGVLMAYAESDSTAQSWLAAFRAALAKLGWTEGSNLRIELRCLQSLLQLSRSLLIHGTRGFVLSLSQRYSFFAHQRIVNLGWNLGLLQFLGI